MDNMERIFHFRTSPWQTWWQMNHNEMDVLLDVTVHAYLRPPLKFGFNKFLKKYNKVWFHDIKSFLIYYNWINIIQ